MELSENRNIYVYFSEEYWWVNAHADENIGRIRMKRFFRVEMEIVKPLYLIVE